MTRRNLIGVAVVVVIVAGLGLWRSTRAAPAAAPTPAAASDTASAAPTGLAAQVVAGRPTLLDFGRGECAACRKMTPVLEELARRHDGRVTVKVLDLKEPAAAALAAELKIVLIPTQVYVGADGREVGRHQGFIALDDIEREMTRLGWTPAR